MQFTATLAIVCSFEAFIAGGLRLAGECPGKCVAKGSCKGEIVPGSCGKGLDCCEEAGKYATPNNKVDVGDMEFAVQVQRQPTDMDNLHNMGFGKTVTRGGRDKQAGNDAGNDGISSTPVSVLSLSSGVWSNGSPLTQDKNGVLLPGSTVGDIMPKQTFGGRSKGGDAAQKMSTMVSAGSKVSRTDTSKSQAMQGHAGMQNQHTQVSIADQQQTGSVKEDPAAQKQITIQSKNSIKIPDSFTDEPVVFGNGLLTEGRDIDQSKADIMHQKTLQRGNTLLPTIPEDASGEAEEAQRKNKFVNVLQIGFAPHDAFPVAGGYTTPVHRAARLGSPDAPHKNEDFNAGSESGR